LLLINTSLQRGEDEKNDAPELLPRFSMSGIGKTAEAVAEFLAGE
jgi:hypothetical protein